MTVRFVRRKTSAAEAPPEEPASGPGGGPEELAPASPPGPGGEPEESAPAPARRGAGEQDRAVLVFDHAPGGLLGDQEPAIGGDFERLLDALGVDLDERPAHPGARVVDDDVGRAGAGVERGEQRSDIFARRRVAGGGARA